MSLASAAIMIRPRCLPDSIFARKVSASEFLHSLDPEETFSLSLGGRVVKPILDGQIVRLSGNLSYDLFVNRPSILSCSRVM